MGFEPTNGGFADLSLGPLGYRAKLLSIANPVPSLCSSRLLLAPIFEGRRALFSAHALQKSALIHSSNFPRYFFSAALTIFASRKNRADSSGGVGLI